MPARILLVDDDPDIRSAYADVLKSAGYDVFPVATGPECIRELTESSGAYDLLFLDVLLPEQTGYDILDVVRSTWAQIPVVLISGKIDSIAHDALDALGAKEFLQKPVEAERLLAAAARWTGDGT
ncbi:MAG: response regulator [Planctomycetes bacterium]|nr:response regulator [Planctomycetota bacterium]